MAIKFDKHVPKHLATEESRRVRVREKRAEKLKEYEEELKALEQSEETVDEILAEMRTW